MSAHANSGGVIAVYNFAPVSLAWVRDEVRDRFEAGDPIYPVCGSGMLIADPSTLLAVADALDSRFRRVAQARYACVRRDAERMRVAARRGDA